MTTNFHRNPCDTFSISGTVCNIETARNIGTVASIGAARNVDRFL